MTKLTCISNLTGFTVGKIYDVLYDDMNAVLVMDDTGKTRGFNKVEGDKDFKNYFIGHLSRRLA